MFFRLTYAINLYQLKDVLPINFDMESGKVKVTVQKIADNPATNLVQIFASTERKISSKHQLQLFEVEQIVSNPIKELTTPIHLDLSRLLTKVIRVIRWRLRIDSPSTLTELGTLAFSPTGQFWCSLPPDLSLRMTFGLPYKQNWDKDEINSIGILSSTAIFEPLGHELLQEAWGLRESNPRSALVIGIAAAETGFKHFVSAIVPDASWLVQNIPSPPLVKMLEEFLPKIPTKSKINGQVLPPSNNSINTLKKAVTLRNQISHGTGTIIKTETVEEVLSCVRDLLYLLDSYSGQNWAWNYIKTRADIIADHMNR